MATLGFLRRDFDVFAIDDFSVSPGEDRPAGDAAPDAARARLQSRIVAQPSNGFLSALRPAYATARRILPLKRGRHGGRRPSGYTALRISRAVHLGCGHPRARRCANPQPTIVPRWRERSSRSRLDLEKSFRGTKIQQYQNWEGRELPNSIAASASFFDGLGDALAKKSGAIDVGFGWSVRDALTVDRAEVLDAFRELGPLYRLILSVAS